MSDYLLNKELEAVKQDREASKIQLEVSKNMMAKQLKQQMENIIVNSYIKPIKKKKPFKVRFSEFINKIKIIMGIIKNES